MASSCCSCQCRAQNPSTPHAGAARIVQPQLVSRSWASLPSPSPSSCHLVHHQGSRILTSPSRVAIRLLSPCRSTLGASDWTALAIDDGIRDEDDVLFQRSFNELCNKAVRVFLRDSVRATEAFRDELDDAGVLLVKQGQMEAATFVFVLYNMLDHKLIKRAQDLQGPYRDAFIKIFNIVEDSGWKLYKEGEEEEEEDISDEERALRQAPGADAYGNA